VLKLPEFPPVAIGSQLPVLPELELELLDELEELLLEDDELLVTPEELLELDEELLEDEELDWLQSAPTAPLFSCR
jgi:hypothetical protein